MVTGWKKSVEPGIISEKQRKLYGAMCLDGMFQINGTYYSFAADGRCRPAG